MKNTTWTSKFNKNKIVTKDNGIIKVIETRYTPNKNISLKERQEKEKELKEMKKLRNICGFENDIYTTEEI